MDFDFNFNVNFNISARVFRGNGEFRALRYLVGPLARRRTIPTLKATGVGRLVLG